MRAVAAASRGQIATLVLPADVSWGEDGEPSSPRTAAAPEAVADDQVGAAADVLSRGDGVLLLLGGKALTERGLTAASRIGVATGARLLAETFPARMERGAGLPAVDRLAYLPEEAEAQLAGVRHLILVGARAPVAFFAYPGRRGDLVPAGCAVTVLADAGQDVQAALERLAGRVAADAFPVLAPASRPAVQPGPLLLPF